MAVEESDLFDSLPDDLVISILSKLSSSAGCPSDFFTVLMICKRLNRLALHSLVLSKGSSKMLPIKAKNWSKSAYRFLKLCADAGNAEARSALLLLEEEKGIFSEELEKLGKAIEEDLANQYFDKEIQMQIFSKDLLVTLDEDLGFEMIQTGGLEGVTAMNSSGSQNLEMIQTGGLEGVTAVNSSSFGAMETPFEQGEEFKRKREEELDEACQGKRPATAYTTPSRPPICGFMAEARQNYGRSVAALATQGSLFSTNEGTQIQTREAAHDKEASTSSWAHPQVELRKFTGDELGLGSENKFQLKDDEAFSEEPRIADMFKDSREKEEQEFMEELKKLEEVLMKDGTNEVFDMDILLDFPGLEMWTAYVKGYCEGELQYSTIWTTPLTAGAMNSVATEVPHHDPLGMEGGTTTAGSSGDPTAQSSPDNKKV